MRKYSLLPTFLNTLVFEVTSLFSFDMKKHHRYSISFLPLTIFVLSIFIFLPSYFNLSFLLSWPVISFFYSSFSAYFFSSLFDFTFFFLSLFSCFVPFLSSFSLVPSFFPYVLSLFHSLFSYFLSFHLFCFIYSPVPFLLLYSFLSFLISYSF